MLPPASSEFNCVRASHSDGHSFGGACTSADSCVTLLHLPPGTTQLRHLQQGVSPQLPQQVVRSQLGIGSSTRCSPPGLLDHSQDASVPERSTSGTPQEEASTLPRAQHLPARAPAPTGRASRLRASVPLRPHPHLTASRTSRWSPQTRPPRVWAGACRSWQRRSGRPMYGIAPSEPKAPG